jgi:hypothetical protein
VHFHVPLHHEPAAPLAATTGVLRDAVAAVRAAPHGAEAHLDVETYTWSVLPDGVPGAVAADGEAGLVAGIAAELRWAGEHLLAAPVTEAAVTRTAVTGVPGTEVPDTGAAVTEGVDA